MTEELRNNKSRIVILEKPRWSRATQEHRLQQDPHPLLLASSDAGASTPAGPSSTSAGVQRRRSMDDSQTGNGLCWRPCSCVAGRQHRSTPASPPGMMERGWEVESSGFRIPLHPLGLKEGHNFMPDPGPDESFQPHHPSPNETRVCGKQSTTGNYFTAVITAAPGSFRSKQKHGQQGISATLRTCLPGKKHTFPQFV